jgi:hypothetical protein
MSVSSVSSVAASTVLKPPESKPPEPNARDEARASRPPVVAALPPGQGTRIDQLA